MRFALAMFLASATMALAQPAPAEQTLSDPALEARAHALMTEIRCVVCEAQSIADSDAELARAMRVFVRERFSAGQDEAGIRAELAALYGEYVLLRPRFAVSTLALWLGPFLLLAGGFAAALTLRRRGAETPELTPEERRALEARLSGLSRSP